MQFGVHLPSFWRDYGTSNVRTAVEETARAAEALGYASVWVNDVVIAFPDEPFAEHGLIEPLITLASLIHLAPHLHLGLGVLVLPQRNAIVVAKQAAALDLLSQGRFILGVGIGHRKAEFQILGADFAHRAAITDESIKLLGRSGVSRASVSKDRPIPSRMPSLSPSRHVVSCRSGSVGIPHLLPAGQHNWVMVGWPGTFHLTSSVQV